jgi:uncharacterized coiled-coil protein SlyX
MMTAKQMLAQKPAKPFEVKRVVRVNPPTVNVAAPNVTVDTREFASAIATISSHLKTMADQHAQTLSTIERNAILLQALIEQVGKMQKHAPAAPPVMKRPGQFHVVFDREDGETVGMRVIPEDAH